MKQIRRVAVWILTLAILAGMMPGYAYINASGWAQPELKRAEELSLLSEELLAADQSQPISRISFSGLVVRLWEKISAKEAPRAQEGVFSDCTDPDALKAAALGIVNGVEPGVFAPDQPIQRQQLAVMLCRALAALPWSPAETDAALFADDGEIAGYASASVYRLRALGILNGDGQNQVHPNDCISNEQAAALLLRTYLIVTGAEADETARLKIDGCVAWLAMPKSKLLAVFGQPDETLDTGLGTVWYVFGTETYEAFFMAALKDGCVTAIFAASGKFAYCGFNCGESAAPSLPEAKQLTAYYSVPSEYTVTQYYNGGNANSLYAVFLREDGSANRITAASGLPDVGRVSMHLVNAFRVSSGKPILGWSEAAALVAQRHSADMAAQKALSHIGSDGSTLSGRMTAGGVLWSTVGENIGSNAEGDLLALHHDWVNSAGYRANLLNDAFTYFGAGSAENGTCYFTQEYFQSFQ